MESRVVKISKEEKKETDFGVIIDIKATHRSKTKKDKIIMLKEGKESIRKNMTYLNNKCHITKV